ncbi:MAG: discoidin domain-containing protein [Akkermansiaceae bacterium]|jgi:hypothetical protein|nr:discoidin domain-containing protein [Akkermansiaceae bacterium]
MAVFGLIFLASQAHAAAVRISWNRNAEFDIAGYEVRYGTNSGRYTETVDAGNRTNTRITGIRESTNYYFVVVAYNRAGLRSRPSAEIFYRRPPDRVNEPPAGRIIAPNREMILVPGQKAYFAGTATDPDGDQNLDFSWTFGERSGIRPMSGAVPGYVEFNVPGTYEVKMEVSDSKGLADATPPTIEVTVVEPETSVVPKIGWSVQFVNSEEADYSAANSIDGDPATMWHTRWRSPNKTPPPHEIQVRIGEQRRLSGFRYVPRQDNATVGNIGRYQFFVSMDGKDWGEPVATGRFSAGAQEKEVFFAPKVGKFVRLVCLSEANGYNDCSMAELSLLQSEPQNRLPIAFGQTLIQRNNKRLAINLKAVDADGDRLTYQILQRPTQGRLGGSAPSLNYRPNPRFSGTDRFTYRATDGFGFSKEVTITIQVKKPAKKRKPASSPGRAALADVVDLTDELDPQQAEISRSTITLDGKQYLTLSLRKPQPGAGTGTTSHWASQVQVSPNLLRWFSGKNHTTVLTDNESVLRIRDNTPITPGRKRFIRLRP